MRTPSRYSLAWVVLVLAAIGLIMAIVIPAKPDLSQNERWIFLMMGESDMSGRGLLSELPVFHNARRVKNYSNAGKWIDGAEPIDDSTYQIDSVSDDTLSNNGLGAAVGPGMAYGDALAILQPGIEIGLVSGAVGGSIISDWARDLSRSTLYGSLLARAREAQSEASNGIVKGVLVFIGKNDAYESTAIADQFTANLLQFVSDMRSDLSLPNLPFVIAVIGDESGISPPRNEWDNIRSQQRLLTGSNISIVETFDLERKQGDPLHLSTAGQLALGQRFAEAMGQFL